MKKMSILGIIAILLVGTVLCIYHNERDDAKAMPSSIHRPVVNSVLIDDPNVYIVKECSTNEPLKLKEKILDHLTIETLSVDRLILTPSQDPLHGVLLTLALPEKRNADILVMDEEGYLVEARVNVLSTPYAAGDASFEVNGYKASIEGLVPGKSYQYVIIDDDQVSKVYDFRTMDEGTVNIGFFGDIQGYKESQYQKSAQVYEAALEKMPDMDLAYFAGDIVDIGDQWAQWLFFDNAFEPYLSSNMFMTTIGNHDVKGSSDLYTHSFNYSDNGPEGLEERCFYIDVPYGRIASVDTESYSRYEEQMDWLKEVMLDVEGFKIVLMHRSVYPISYDEGHVRQWASVFESAGVDLVLSGHDHIYSRTSVAEGEKQALGEGVTYIVGGSGSGSKFYFDKGEGHRYWRDIVYDEDEPVFILIQMEEEKISVEAYAMKDETTEMIDSFQLIGRWNN